MSDVLGGADPVAQAELIENADSYTDIFPDEGSIKEVYHRLARIAHPDLVGWGATDMFQKLTQFKDEAEKMAAAGRFGERAVLATITTRKGRYTVTRKLGVTGLVTLYDATTAGDKVLLKVARSPKDNDLLAAEAFALKKLHAADDDLTRAYPVLLDSFMYQPGRHRANVLALQTYAGHTLAQLRVLYPGGMDPRHLVWIWRKLLMALGFAHDQGIIHGAVLPPHILILPAVHGVMLTDWYYSSIDGHLIKAVVDGYWYPEEVTDKEPPSAATDIAMAAQAMLDLGGALPKPLRAFFNGCVLTKQSMRPQDSWVLLKEFDGLLERIGVPFYPRRFVELTVP